MKCPLSDGTKNGMLTPAGSFPQAENMILIHILFCVFIILVMSACGGGIIQEKTNAIDGQEVILIPEGKYIVGSDIADVGISFKSFDENKVYNDKFWIYKTEVTTSQYSKFLNNINYIDDEQSVKYILFDYYQKVLYVDQRWIVEKPYENLPVENISYAGAEAYCNWAGGRLPSNQEWELAARGPKGYTYPWGDEFTDICEFSNSDGCVGQLMEVGSYPTGASPFGLLDMLGNVEEWTDGWFPVGTQKTRTYRGGSHASPVYPLHQFTGDFGSGLGYGPIGFRCVIDNMGVTNR